MLTKFGILTGNSVYQTMVGVSGVSELLINVVKLLLISHDG